MINKVTITPGFLEILRYFTKYTWNIENDFRI